jgi:hypothetical protein
MVRGPCSCGHAVLHVIAPLDACGPQLVGGVRSQDASGIDKRHISGASIDVPTRDAMQKCERSLATD